HRALSEHKTLSVSWSHYLGTATPDIDLAPTSSEQTLNFFAWMEQIDQATPVTPGAVTANATYVLDYK
ncbi:fimbrial protein, partial [Shigella boydii]|uniref:fimbrial protein n=2 Tax=Shigella boydii TaxID=621 RepID=UPI000EE8761A